jgi:hypothetical protein
MEQNLDKGNNYLTGRALIRYFILIYWIFFWLLNVIDKIIGGAHFLFVGKDRFAQIERYFDSIGLGSPIVANIALVITAGLEIFALVFFCGALYHHHKKSQQLVHTWFSTGMAFTLITFIYFSFGDQVFGDHFELLEHGLFWLIGVLSWLVFNRANSLHIFNFDISNKTQLKIAYTLMIAVSAITSLAIFSHNSTSFIQRTEAVQAIRINSNKYKIKFPFLAGSKAFENTIAKFQKEHPDDKITYIYTVPAPLRLGESDGLIIFIQTESR